MGGEWAAGMPLAIEHWPAKFRGLVSGLLQGGFYWGYIASALAFHYLYPYFSSIPDPFSQEVGSSIGWRVMFWIGVVPALFVLWIRTGVAEARSGKLANVSWARMVHRRVLSNFRLCICYSLVYGGSRSRHRY